MNMDNPFVFNGYAGAEYFCDREKELAELQRFAETAKICRKQCQCHPYRPTPYGQDGTDISADG